jgi:nitrogen fixation protein FixH
MAKPMPASRLPWIFVAAMGVVVVVNAGMVAAALSTYSGLSHRDAFGRGLAYNTVLAAAERRDALGWRLAVTLGAADAAGQRAVAVDLADRDGAPLGGAVLAAVFVRPVERVAPVPAVLVERRAGQHAGTVVLPAAGQWDLRIGIARGGERLEFSQRVFAR